jgi:hypothetical protein
VGRGTLRRSHHHRDAREDGQLVPASRHREVFPGADAKQDRQQDHDGDDQEEADAAPAGDEVDDP